MSNKSALAWYHKHKNSDVLKERASRRQEQFKTLGSVNVVREWTRSETTNGHDIRMGKLAGWGHRGYKHNGHSVGMYRI